MEENSQKLEDDLKKIEEEIEVSDEDITTPCECVSSTSKAIAEKIRLCCRVFAKYFNENFQKIVKTTQQEKEAADTGTPSSAVVVSEKAETASAATEKTEAEQAVPLKKKTVKIKYRNAKAKEVKIAGDFSKWRMEPMEKKTDGSWNYSVKLPQGKYSYKFVVDGMFTKDLNNPLSEPDGFGGEKSVFEVNILK